MVEMFVCNEEPEFLMQNFPFNFSQNSDFVSFLMNITSNSQKLWFDERNARWGNDSNPKYVATLTRNGIGFTFNTFSADEFLDRNT